MKNNIEILLEEIESHSQRKLNFKKLIFLLIETSRTYNLKTDFENLTFFGKFIFNARRVLNNKIMNQENYNNLLTELQNDLKIFNSSLKNIIGHFNEDTRKEFETYFFVEQKPEELYLLIEDLNQIKNYQIDKKVELIKNK